MSTETNKLNGDTEKRFSAEKSIFQETRFLFFLSVTKRCTRNSNIYKMVFYFIGFFNTNVEQSFENYILDRIQTYVLFPSITRFNDKNGDDSLNVSYR